MEEAMARTEQALEMLHDVNELIRKYITSDIIPTKLLLILQRCYDDLETEVMSKGGVQ